jgi:hypothetical protein
MALVPADRGTRQRDRGSLSAHRIDRSVLFGWVSCMRRSIDRPICVRCSGTGTQRGQETRPVL